jgi:hypothetical protein
LNIKFKNHSCFKHRFPINRWVDKDGNAKIIEIENKNNKTQDNSTKGTTKNDKNNNKDDKKKEDKNNNKDDKNNNTNNKNNKKDDSGNKKKYHVIIVTGDEAFAGTDANVVIDLIGDKKSTGLIPLNKENCTSKNKDLFETGKTDEFDILVGDIGKVKVVFNKFLF